MEAQGLHTAGQISALALFYLLERAGYFTFKVDTFVTFGLAL